MADRSSILRRYSIDEILFRENIGIGTFGEVWSIDILEKRVEKRVAMVDQLDTEPMIRKTMAIKIVESNVFDTMTPSLVNEICYGTTLDHPHLIKYQGVVGPISTQSLNINLTRISSRSCYGLIMDRADGDLQYLMDIGLPDRQIKDISYQLVSTISYLTDHDIAHRDIKMSNVLYRQIDDKYHVYLCDFGLTTNDVFVNRMHSSAVYSYPYRPPEIAISDDDLVAYDGKVEVWALGCLIFELMFGYRLFDNYSKGHRNTNEQLCCNIFSRLGTPHNKDSEFYQIYHTNRPRQKIAIREDPLIQIYDSDLRSLLRKMLQIDPINRCTIGECLQHRYFRDFSHHSSISTVLKLRSPIFDTQISGLSLIHDVPLLIRPLLECCRKLYINHHRVFFSGLSVFLHLLQRDKIFGAYDLSVYQLASLTLIGTLFSPLQPDFLEVADTCSCPASVLSYMQRRFILALNGNLLVDTPLDQLYRIAYRSNDVKTSLGQWLSYCDGLILSKRKVVDLAADILTIMSTTSMLLKNYGKDKVIFNNDLPLHCLQVATICLLPRGQEVPSSLIDKSTLSTLIGIIDIIDRERVWKNSIQLTNDKNIVIGFNTSVSSWSRYSLQFEIYRQRLQL